MRAWVVRVLICVGGLVGIMGAAGTSAAVAANAFTPVPGSPYQTGANPLSVAVSPDGSLIAVANSSDNDISVFSVSSTGALTPLPGSPYAAGHGPSAVAFDPASSVPLLEVANATDKTVEPFIEVSGQFVPLTPVSTGTSGAPESLSFDAAGTLLAAGIDDGEVAMLFIGVNGEPTLVGGAQQPVTTSLPYAVALSPDGATLAVGDGANDHVNLYAVNGAGDIGSQLSASPLPIGSGSDRLNVRFSPDGRLLAVSALNGNSVSLFKVPAYGPAASTVTVTSPAQLAFSPASKLLAIGASSSAAVYSIDAAGGLSAVPGSPYAIRAGATIPDAALARGGGVLAGLDENASTIATFTVGAPSATIITPASGASYALGQPVATSFTCADALDGPGVASCADSDGASGTSGTLNTSTTGQHTYSVTATSVDGQTSSSSVPYSVAAPPTIAITAPASGAKYTLDQPVTAAFSCADGTGGPGIASCSGSVANGAKLATGTAGTFTFTVTATSGDGQKTTKTVSYTVAPAAPSANTLTLRLGSGSATAVDLIGQSLTFAPASASATNPLGGITENRFSVMFDLTANDPTALKAVTKPGASWDTATLTVTEKSGTILTYTLEDVAPVSWIPGGASGKQVTATFAYRSLSVSESTTTRIRIPTSSKAPNRAALTTFKGVIVHLIPMARSFVLAEGNGQLVAVHSTDARIKIGKLVTVKAASLIDGTYKAKTLTFAGRTKIALLQGSVTFVSKAQHRYLGRYFVLSASGASVPVEQSAATHTKAPPLGRSGTILVSIEHGKLFEQTLRALSMEGAVGTTVCVEGQFVGLTTATVNGKPQLELEIANTDQSSSNVVKEKEQFPVTSTQSEILSSVVASGTHMLKLCGAHEKQTGSLQGGSIARWSKLRSAYVDSDSPTKLF